MTEINNTKKKFDYDLIVIGGGSGGLACAKRAARILNPTLDPQKKTVAVLDYVTPSPHGTTWKLGGTCVNVGCIPKKLMHQGGLLAESLHDAQFYGWKPANVFPSTQQQDVDTSSSHKEDEGGTVKYVHDWSTLRNNVNMHIRGSNFSYTADLRKNKIDYFNSLGSFIDEHTLQLNPSIGDKTTLTAENFVIATGGRPTYLNIPGAELAITSDDLFSLKKPPGKTLCIGAGYISLECAGFLSEFGYETSLMIRSRPLRTFDIECVSKIVKRMEKKTKFLYGNPNKLEKTQDGRILVEWTSTQSKEVFTEVYDTVLMAVGRTAVTNTLGLDKVNVKIDEKTKKVVGNDVEQSSVKNIYAIGDVIDRGLELTPVAIKAGKLLAERLFGGGTEKMDYHLVPTTVFTPIEYGFIGMSEEAAIKKYGSVVIYKKNCNILEHALPHNEEQLFVKLVCVGKEELVVGFHYVGPNAGEVTQGIDIAMKLKATKKDFDNAVGIHPTNAENYTKLELGLTQDTGC